MLSFSINIDTYNILAASRHKRDTEDDINKAYDDAERELRGIMDKFYGGVCVTDAQCLDTIAFCDHKAGVTGEAASALGLGNIGGVDGQCRPNIWIWIVMAGIVLLFMGACICCICCGLCSCLYK